MTAVVAPPGYTNRTRQHGFTLLEVLVALVVLGLLVTGLTQGLRLGVSAWHQQARSLALHGDLDATDRTLRGLVARMDAGGVSGQPPVFNGAFHSLTFKSSLPEAASGLAGRDVVVTFAVGPRHRLELLWIPYYRNPTKPIEPARALLIDEVERVEFSYWDDAKATWQREWAGQTLPKLVRIRIVPVGATGPRGPDIVVHPMRDRWRL